MRPTVKKINDKETRLCKNQFLPGIGIDSSYQQIINFSKRYHIIISRQRCRFDRQLGRSMSQKQGYARISFTQDMTLFDKQLARQMAKKQCCARISFSQDLPCPPSCTYRLLIQQHEWIVKRAVSYQQITNSSKRYYIIISRQTQIWQTFKQTNSKETRLCKNQFLSAIGLVR
ncbi:hypothetical protein M9H77_35384 [Catharanthus roseus]|uniref:Uncharacterized protein n=1 Tax=Catharanthus roseus TaxID=4058 RepID=A0ACB9ZQL5_CATRO|nr:hypothetical protein M9H77_35384 [Catharanthus roseus]